MQSGVVIFLNLPDSTDFFIKQESLNVSHEIG